MVNTDGTNWFECEIMFARNRLAVIITLLRTSLNMTSLFWRLQAWTDKHLRRLCFGGCNICVCCLIKACYRASFFGLWHFLIIPITSYPMTLANIVRARKRPLFVFLFLHIFCSCKILEKNFCQKGLTLDGCESAITRASALLFPNWCYRLWFYDVCFLWSFQHVYTCKFLL